METLLPLEVIFEMICSSSASFEKRFALIKEQKEQRIKETEKLNEWEIKLKDIESKRINAPDENQT